MNTTDRPPTSVVEGILWWLCLCGAPAVPLAIELFHPAGFTQAPGMWEYLSKPQPYAPGPKAIACFGPEWWFTLHMTQTPMIGLVCIGLWSMVKGIDIADHIPAGVFAWLSRIATFVTIIYFTALDFTALDAIGGFGLGRYILRWWHCAALDRVNRAAPDRAVATSAWRHGGLRDGRRPGAGPCACAGRSVVGVRPLNHPDPASTAAHG
jgi:hypothetical protein